MKIAEIVCTFPPYHGGMGYLCFHHSLELSRLGHDVTVFTLDYKKLDYNNDPDDFKIQRLKTPLVIGDGGIAPQLFFKLKGFDILHLHYPLFGSAEYVYLSALLRNQKLFITYHMDVFGTTPLKNILIKLYEPLLMKRIIRKADRISGPSQAYLKQSKAADFMPWNRVVPMQHGGVDTEKFHPRSKNDRLVAKYNLKDKTVILFVGNLLAVKGVDILIEAVSKIADQKIVLLIVGGGYEEATYRKQVKEKNLESRVFFCGSRSPDKDLKDYYNLGDFLVLPSIRSESYGLVLLEAMASGIPVIVTSLPGPTQIVDDGIDGLVAEIGNPEDLKNKIEFLSENKEQRLSMGLAGRKKVVENYSWGKIGKQLEKSFLELTGNP